MDALERLREAGRVDEVDLEVLEAALRRLTDAIGRELADAGPSRRAHRPRHVQLRTVASVAALAAAAALVTVTWLGHRDPTAGWRDSRSSAHEQSSVRAAAGGASSRPGSTGSPTIAAVLTAFTASRNDVLMVTKTVRGEGTCCKSVIWVTPAQPVPGASVRGRVQNFTLGGSALTDTVLTYTAAATPPAVAVSSCGAIFGRPRAVEPSATGVPGALTEVNYRARTWAEGAVRVQPGTLPSPDDLRVCIRAGRWTVISHGTLRGLRMIEFGAPAGAGGFRRLSISATTFLPTRLIQTTPTPYGPITITFVFSFLPPTAANQAILGALHIPAGFSRQTLPG